MKTAVFLMCAFFVLARGQGAMTDCVRPDNRGFCPRTPASPGLPAQETKVNEEGGVGIGVVVEGQLVEKGTKKPLPDVNVFILPLKIKTTTFANGKFKFENVPPGDYEFVVNLTGYEKYSKFFEIKESRADLKLLLERTSYQYFETTVVGKAEKRDDTTQSLKQEDFLKMPGAGGDPVKAVQNLPGANRTGGSAQVVIQGGEPEDTRYAVNGHDVPAIFHFGGLSSIVMPEAVESIDFLSAGYGPEYGNAMGGIISLNTRKPKTDRMHGMAFMDIFNTGGLLEGPIDDTSSYLISGRYSYIGAVLKAAMKNNDEFNLTVAPSFSDLTAIYNKKLNERDELNINFISSSDTMEFLLNEPVGDDPALRGKFYLHTQFYRLMPEWKRKLEGGREFFFTVGAGETQQVTDVGTNYLDFKTRTMSTRGEFLTPVTSLWKSYLGFDNQYNWFDYNIRIPSTYSEGGVRNPISTGETREVSINGHAHYLALYNRNEWKLADDSNWTLYPNVRMDYFTLTKQYLAQPRVAARYQVNPFMFYRAATGVYYQSPTGQQVSKDFGNPDVKAPRAIHYAVGLGKDFREGSNQGFNLTTGLFYKKLENLVISSSKQVVRDGVTVAENYNNDGTGHIHGLEAQLQYTWDLLSLTTSYTYAQSFRQQPGQPEYPSQYDQTHSFNLIGSYETGKWLYSTRFRYVTGSPYTPVTASVFDADNDVYVPIRGDYFSERNPAFSQLDVRADRKYVFDTWILSLYVEIQNLLNQKNQEGVNYSYDYSQKEAVTGLPMIPSFGLKGEF